MIQMREADNSKAAVLRELTENQSERNRIGPPGQTNQYAAPRGTETVTLDSAANLLMQSSQRLALALRLASLAQGTSRLARLRACHERARNASESSGAGGRTRTADPALMRRVL